jgi:hypothetical protein
MTGGTDWQLRTSGYVIYVDLPADAEHKLVIHGYPGAYDRVSLAVVAYLRSLETLCAPAGPAPVVADATIERLTKRGYLTPMTPAEEVAFFTWARPSFSTELDPETRERAQSAARVRWLLLVAVMVWRLLDWRGGARTRCCDRRCDSRAKLRTRAHARGSSSAHAAGLFRGRLTGSIGLRDLVSASLQRVVPQRGVFPQATTRPRGLARGCARNSCCTRDQSRSHHDHEDHRIVQSVRARRLHRLAARRR